MNEIDINAAVKSAIPAMVAKLQADLGQRMISQAEQVASQELSNAVKKWVQEALVPEIIAQLEANKQEMIDKAKLVAVAVGDGLAAALKTKIDENLKNSWTVRDITSKLIG